MKRLTIFFFFITSILFSCCSSKDKGMDTISLTFESTGISSLNPAWTRDSLLLTEYAGDKAVFSVICVPTSMGGGEYRVKADVPASIGASGQVRYVLEQRGVKDGIPSQQTRRAGALPLEADVITGSSSSFSSLPDPSQPISVVFHRYTVSVHSTFNGLPSTQKVRRVVLTLPQDGVRYSLDCGSGVAANDDFICGIKPCTLAEGSKISVIVVSDTDTFIGESAISESTMLEEGATIDLSFSLKSAPTFTNPVVNTSLADPTIWKTGNVFNCVSTGVGTVRTSKDLVNWTSSGTSPLISEAKASCKALGANFWAPDVVKLGSYTMMYLTCYNSQTDCKIAVLNQNSAGTFDYIGCLSSSKITGIKDTIDPEVVQDPSTGKIWLFFGSTGRIHRVELNSLGISTKGEYSAVAGVDVDSNASRTKVFEGAYLHYHDGWWYLFASAGQYWNSTYKVVVGRSRTLEGEFVNKDGLKMADGYATTVISSTSSDNLFGPGHNGEIFTDISGQDYIFYHCHCASIDSQSRYGCLQRIYWAADGWPYVEGGKPAVTDRAPIF